MIALRCPPSTTYADKFTCDGTLLFMPVELIDGAWLLGRMFNILMTDWSQADQTTFEVLLDPETSGVFRVLGWGTAQAAKVAARIS